MTSAATPRGRLGWLDAVRGLAIVVVVFGHVWRGLVSPGILKDPVLFAQVDDVIYLFHMPVFFLASGFVFLSARWSGLVPFVLQKCQRLLWPALLWFYLFVAVNVAAGSATNSQFTLEKLLGPPDFIGTYLWFLWALFLMQMALVGLKLAPATGLRLWLVVGAAVFVIVLRFSGLNLPLHLMAALIYAPVFLVGVGAALLWTEQGAPGWLPRRAVFGAGLVTFAAAQMVAFYVPQGSPVLDALGLAAALGFAASVAGVWAMRPGNRLVRWLCDLGRASMAIYLAHIFFTAGARIVLMKLGVTALAPHVLLGTGLGVLGPLIVLALARRFNLARVLGF